MGKKNSATDIVFADDVTTTSLRPVVPFNRKFYSFDRRSVDDGGPVVFKPKKRLAITIEQFRSFANSGSDKLWRDFLLPTNLWFLKTKEGKTPYIAFDIEGVPQASNLVFYVPPEVASRVFPVLKEKVVADPKAYGLKVGEDGEVVAKDQLRIDALDWTPSDCSIVKDGEKKVVRPSPVENGWHPVNKDVEKLLLDTQKVIQPVSAARVANEKRSREDELDGACKVLRSHGFDFRLVPNSAPEIDYQILFSDTDREEVALTHHGRTTFVTRYASHEKMAAAAEKGADESVSTGALSDDE